MIQPNNRVIFDLENEQVFASVVGSFCLRYAFASGSLPSMEHQRTYNGFTTEVERYCIGGGTRAFSRLLIVFYAE